MLAFISSCAVPPLEIISHPKVTSASANATIPVLSYTDRSARGGLTWFIFVYYFLKPQLSPNSAIMSTMCSPASVGLRPTRTFASLKASIFACAVPFPPETIAPA